MNGKMVTTVAAREAAQMVVGGHRVRRILKKWYARNDRRSFKQALKVGKEDEHEPRRVDAWKIA